jgi:hypothetical protein
MYPVTVERVAAEAEARLGMPILFMAMAFVAIAITALGVARRRRARRPARDPMTQVFRGREFRRFDAHLEVVAQEECRRLERDLARYLAGRAGHVVVVSKVRDGIALELSDGRRLALGGISLRTVELLNRRTQFGLLRPESVHRDTLSCRLLLRGAAGGEIGIYARNVALAS